VVSNPASTTLIAEIDSTKLHSGLYGGASTSLHRTFQVTWRVGASSNGFFMLEAAPSTALGSTAVRRREIIFTPPGQTAQYTDYWTLQSGDRLRVVPQSTFLFDDTVRGNVTLGRDHSDDEVWEALRIAQADGFVRALPGGLDARLGERGASLSGGQRQRLSLARALVGRPRLLVMDDATSAVDPDVEARILAGLRERAGATVLVVAYRKATISLSDEVVFLADGAVAAQGEHTELLATQPAYADIVEAYEVTT